MKKLIYGSLMALAIGAVASCNNDTNVKDYWGDLDLAQELSVDSKIVSLVTGDTYPLQVLRETDTTYAYPYAVYDTLKDEAGEPILDAKGKLQITESEVFVKSNKTAKLIEFKKMAFPSFTENEYDTLSLEMTANCNWIAPMREAVAWYANVDGSIKGGGDSYFKFSTRRVGIAVHKTAVRQEIMTQDSMVIYVFNFVHTGTKYNGEEY